MRPRSLDMNEDQLTAEIGRRQRRNAEEAPSTSLDENVRLLLQYNIDHPQARGGLVELEGCEKRACDLGLMKEILPTGGSGPIYYDVTQAGRDALNAANSELGNQATRMVRRAKYFGDLKPIVYGWPFRVPLSAKVVRVNDCLVQDERTLLQKIFG